MNLFKIIIATFFITIFNTSSYAQDKLNQYGYILIPKQLELKRKQNQFNINTILKSYLNKYNFTAFIQGESVPSSINPCDVLRVSINEDGFLTTKISITFIDCNNEPIYTTQEGVSRIKEFKPAYFEAFKKTVQDPNIKNHTFYKKTSTVEKKAKTIKNKFILEFKDTQYSFNETKVKGEYIVTSKFKSIGTLKKKANSNFYILDAGDISGTGTFDNFGNFNLIRVNPANQATLTDVMSRID